MNLLEVKTLNLADIESELSRKIQKSPAFFQGAPIVIGFELLPEQAHDAFDLHGLVAICRQLGMLPVATRSGAGRLQAMSVEAGLAVLHKGREKHVGAITEKPMPELAESRPVAPGGEPDAASADTTPATEASQVKASPTKIVSTPIRSGQQIYAPGGDLVILAAVSPGAEVLADGNIHIYGALRGRALAGVKGDESARIFCASQEAELVAIAGHFMVDEQLKGSHWQKAVQIQIDKDTVSICPLA